MIRKLRLKIVGISLVTVGQGWRAIANKRDGSDFLGYRDTALIAELTLTYAAGQYF